MGAAFGIFSFIGALLALGGGWWLTDLGFEGIRDFRQLERVPRIEAAAILPGEVNLAGRAQTWREVLRAPDSGTPTLYYRYVVEREETDSDGDTRWVTVSSETDYVPFLLNDNTGEVLVAPEGAEAELESAHVRYSGDYRYTEYRIDPGEPVFLFGLARAQGDGYVVGFTEPGSYSPIISEGDETGARRGMALSSLMTVLTGVAALGFGVMLLCFALRIHQTYLLLGGTTAVLMVVLVTLGLRMGRADVEDALAHGQRTEAAAVEAIAAMFADQGLRWSGDWAELAREHPPQAALGGWERYRVDRIRLFLHQAALRAERLRQQWPERLFVPPRAQPPVPLSPAEQGKLADLESGFEPTRLAWWQTGLIAAIGIIVALVGAGFGFGHVRLKRLIENLPTTPLGGITYGLNEVSGRARLADGVEGLSGPLSGRRCVQFHYTVEEKRGSGKKAEWVTIEDRTECMPFLLSDGAHEVQVHADEAEIITRHESSKQAGRLRYHETRLEPGDKLYVLASAVLPPEGDALVLRKGEGGVPCIVSNYSEREVMLRKARWGFFLLVIGMLGGVGVGLAATGGEGAFGALPWLLCAAIPLVYLTVVLAILMYNDLVFLRQRISATWGNIEVSLRKRFDLIPNLERLVKDYFAHEQAVQQMVTSLRSQADHASFSHAQGEALVSTERQLQGRLMGLVEAYPELKASDTVQRLMAGLARMENEIAFMRQGHNNAVERYNTRRSQFPEVLIARIFRFPELEPFKASG